MRVEERAGGGGPPACVPAIASAAVAVAAAAARARRSRQSGFSAAFAARQGPSLWPGGLLAASALGGPESSPSLCCVVCFFRNRY